MSTFAPESGHVTIEIDVCFVPADIGSSPISSGKCCADCHSAEPGHELEFCLVEESLE
jgi:hypothetical protein